MVLLKRLLTTSKGVLGGAVAAMLVMASSSQASHLGAFLLGHNQDASGTTGVISRSDAPTLSGENLRTNGNGAIGVFGRHGATTGSAPGVRGVTRSSTVFATGVDGIVSPDFSASQSAGVRGRNWSTTLAGSTAHTYGYGVWGQHFGKGFGVFGENGGSAVGGAGVGGRGEIGVRGDGGDVGVKGTGETGVSGEGYVGVYGTATADGYAAMFDGRVQANGVVADSDGYLRAPTTTGAPSQSSCDAATEAGRLVVRVDGPPDLYICRGAAGWVAK